MECWSLVAMKVAMATGTAICLRDLRALQSSADSLSWIRSMEVTPFGGTKVAMARSSKAKA